MTEILNLEVYTCLASAAEWQSEEAPEKQCAVAVKALF